MNTEARKIILNLLSKYNEKFKTDKSMMGNEKQACQSLIVPFIRDFLCWDADDPSELGTEEFIAGKKLDYVIKNQGISQFIIEAKAPSIDIFDNEPYYKQAVYYGFNKDTEFVILTNFRQIVILHSLIQTDPLKSEIARIDLTLAKEEDLELLLNFEKSKWLSDGKSKLYQRLGSYKRRLPVDKQLLTDLKEWRELLLTNIKKNSNSNKYDFDDENEFSHVEEEVQRFIDRLIFICLCEDKELNEPKLKSILTDKKTRFSLKPGFLLNQIQELFKVYEKTHNSDLFESGSCDKFQIDDDKLIQVLEDLRDPKGKLPYDFKTIEADILGKAYEGFIGHVQTGKKRFKEKEDIGKRKKEGIYYTPKYIVDYIVNNTVREYIKDKSFEEINKVRILDPACGSGSFLLRAFDVLVEESKRKLKRDLTYSEKKELLLNCIYGVDLDRRAVEIAKLNLALRLAERNQHLPKLRENIKNGNSLIEDKEIAGYDAFVWEEEFPEIMKDGGFDVVVGNPPYFKIFEDNPINKIKDYLEIKNGMMNVSAVFINKSLKLLKEDCLLGMIVPKMLAFTDSWEKIRAKLLGEYTLLRVVDCEKAFKDVLLEQLIFIVKKKTPLKNNEVAIDEIENKKIIEKVKISQKKCFDENSIYLESNPIAYKIKDKMESCSVRLGQISKITLGLGIQSLDSFQENKQKGFDKALRGNDIQRYTIRGCKYYDPDDKKIKTYKNTIDSFKKKHIVAQRIVAHIRDHIKITATLDEEGLFSFNTVTNIFTTNKDYEEKYILALLNSAPIQYYTYKFIYKNAIRSMDFYKAYAEKIPIANSKYQQQIIKLVDKMLVLNKQIQQISDKQPSERARIEEEIKRTDAEIDEMVYKIYEITEEEKKIIEESLR